MLRRARHHIVQLLLLIVAVTAALADPVDRYQAAYVVDEWLSFDSAPLGARLEGRVAGVDAYADSDGTTAYYVVRLDPTGFAIVAADDLVEPILGFASGGVYDPADTNPLGALVTSDARARLAEVRGRADEARRAGRVFVPDGRLLAARRKWDRLLDRAEGGVGTLGLSSVSDERVSPLIQSKWDQGSLYGKAIYNYYTPPGPDGSTSNYPCGCVATAMAQIMRFWQYPVAGIGVRTFTIQVDGVPQSASTRGGDGSGGPYLWTDMPLIPSSSITLLQQQAIGALCYDAGVSVGMQYTASGSGASVSSVSSRLRTTFGYSNAKYGDNNGANIGSGLNGMVNPNLDAGFPVDLGITGPSGGHSVVCDGYGYNASTLYHHLNMGWHGISDAWYNLPTVDAYYTFNSVHTCVYNIYVTGTGEIISGRVTDSQGHPIPDVQLTAVGLQASYGPVSTNAQGIYAFAKIPASFQPKNNRYAITPAHAQYVFTSRDATISASADGAATSGNVWGVDFVGSGGPAVTSFAINNGAALATSRTVTLNNTCSGSPTHYVASESSSFAGASWLAYSTAPSFTLSAGDGAKTVYFRVRNSIGTESPAASDSITIDTAPPTTTASPAGGVYNTSTNVALSPDETATVYYTTDGSEPTVASPVYSSPIPVSDDRTLRFFAVDSAGNHESPKKLESYWILSEEGSITAAKALADGQTVRLGNKVLYFRGSGYAYIEGPGRTSGIRLQGTVSAEEGQLVCLVGTMATTVGGERCIQLTAITPDGPGTVGPLALNNAGLIERMLDGLFVTCWGRVKPGSITGNSFVITDGSPGPGVKIVTPGAPRVNENDFVVRTGAAGYDGSRVVYVH